MNTTETNSQNKLPVLTFERQFSAPIELVFQVWTDPAHLARWWGPKGFTNPRCEFEARPGGAVHIDMQGPDGTIYPMTGTVKEITPPNRLVFFSAAIGPKGKPELEVISTVTLETDGEKTKLTLRAEVTRMTETGKQYAAGMEEGWTQSLVRLEQFVSTLHSELH